jgi:NADP-dependent 3-hydroxy acid dehydrogenase YdfG
VAFVAGPVTDAPAASSLAGRSALVTGASRGIGLAIARTLVGAGARVAMLARSTDALAREAAALGDGAIAIPCDLTDEKELDDALARLREGFSAIDLLVSNAGVFPLARVEETQPAEFAKALTLNLGAPFALLHALVPGMRARRFGDIVTIGSIADRQIFPENGAYAATKFGARALHEVLRAELRGTGVRTSLVSPGPVDTSIWDGIDPDVRAGLPSRAAMLRPEDVADAVLWVVTRPAHVDVDELRLGRS